MSWLDVDEPTPDYYRDVYASPYYVSGGVSLRSAPASYTWAAPGYDPLTERRLTEAEQVLERERRIRKELGL